MASIGHIAVATATSRATAHRSQNLIWFMIFLSLLSYLPDFDVIGFRFGIAYGDPWGHRGATHSLVFALVIGLLAGFAGKFFKFPYWKMALISVCLIASHGALDAMTDGGGGVALLWPFSLKRYFFPWRFIPVSPIGFSYFSDRGLKVLIHETLYFSPFLIYSLWPRSKRAKSN